MPDTPLKQLSAHGQSVWIDFLSRPFVQDGELEALVARRRRRRHLEPDDLPGRDRRGRRLRRAAARGAQDARPSPRRSSSRSPSRTSRPPATCCARRGTRPARTPATAGSRSRSTRTSRTTREGTIEEAKRLHALVDRPNLFVKIPATKEGLPAIEESIAAGIPINVTLIFSLERHREVAEAYVRGVQRYADSGGDLARLASVASFFVSRVDTEADKRLDAVGGHDELKGTLAIANAKLAYETYKEVFAGEQWEALRAKGASGAALPVGVDVDEEPRVPRRDLRRGADRPRHRQHDAARDRRGVPGPRRGARVARPRTSTARAARSRRSRRPGSTTTTSSRRSSARAWRSSPSRSSSCSPTSRPSATRWWRHDAAERFASSASSCASTPSAAARRPAPATRPPRCRPPT